MTDKYMLGPDGRTVVPMDDLHEWAYQLDHQNRQVGQTRVGRLTVSTAFIGLDYSHGRGPKSLFETLVYRDDDIDPLADERGCATWSEAEAMHARYVEKAKSGGYDVARSSS